MDCLSPFLLFRGQRYEGPTSWVFHLITIMMIMMIVLILVLLMIMHDYGGCSDFEDENNQQIFYVAL